MVLEIKTGHEKSSLGCKKSLVEFEKDRGCKKKYIKILFSFLFFFLVFSQKAHTETTRTGTRTQTQTQTQTHHSISDEQSDCQSHFVRHQCQEMIDNSPEVPREYFLNCSETNKQVKETGKKISGRFGKNQDSETLSPS